MNQSNMLMHNSSATARDGGGALNQTTGRWMPVEFIGAEPVERCEDAARILAAADAILAQGELLLSSIADAAYTGRVPAAFNASIGGHYRHCLDHFTSILRDLGGIVIDYDNRGRDTRVETEPAFALATTSELRSRLRALNPVDLSRSLQARCEVSYARGDAPATRSTLGRELVYAIAHAIHHYALIHIMARLQHADMPENFGVAPSTVNHLRAARNG